MDFGSKFVYLGNEFEDEEEVKVSEVDDVVLSDSDVSDDDGETCLLDILDTAGQEEYSSVKDLYVREGNGFVIIYSITDQESFKEAEAIFRWLKRMKNDDCYAILVANKQDLKDEATVTADNGKELATRLGIPLFETSAKDGTGIIDAMKGLIRIVPRKGSDYKVVMLGSGAVGKSSITIRFVNDTFIDDYDPTIEDSYRKMINVDGLMAVSKDDRKAAKKAKRAKKQRKGSDDFFSVPFRQGGAFGNASMAQSAPRKMRPRSAAPKAGGFLHNAYNSILGAIGRPKSAQVPDAAPPPPPAPPLPQQMVSAAPTAAPPPLAPPLPGAASKMVKERKTDGNVVLISMRTLEDEPKLVTGDPIRCQQCEAILTETATLVPGDNNKQIWNCEFCGHANKDLDIAEDEIPKGDRLDYMLSPATEPEADGATEEAVEDVKKPARNSGVIVYCMDISSSMQAACAIPESQTSWRQERLGVSDENCVTRLNCIQMAVTRLAEQLKDEQPQKQILLVVFSSHVEVKAGGSGQGSLPQFRDVERVTFEQLLEKGSTLCNNFPLKPMEESYEEIVRAVENLRTTGCTALGPALSICAGFVSGIPSSEIVLCTDGEPNVGVGSSGMGNTAAFYESVGKYARSKNVTINILAVEGASCDLQSVSAAAEHSGGTTNKLNPAELVRQLRSIAQNEVVATSVTVRFFLHPDFIFDEPEYGDNLSHLEKEVGSARKETDLTFRFKVRDASKAAQINSVPFQVQIVYTRMNGMKCLRVLSKRNEVTTKRKDMEENINTTVLSVSTMRTTAQLAKLGKGQQAQHMLKNVKRMVARGAKSEEQKEARLAFNSEIEALDEQLTYNNQEYAAAPGQQTDNASNMIQQYNIRSSANVDVGKSKMKKVMNRAKMNPKSKAAYYAYKNNMM